jgi:Holliday junction resolvasome RuvABC ATP-dependent DNA helicase subunit
VATATPAGAAALPASLRERAAVRVELGPWDAHDVAAFLAHALERVGGRSDIFSAEAASTVARFAGGVPRTVSRLAHLALTAAAGDGLEQVDAATVERAWRELAPSACMPGADRETQTDDPDEPAIAPRVRVVRRLWG